MDLNELPRVREFTIHRCTLDDLLRGGRNWDEVVREIARVSPPGVPAYVIENDGGMTAVDLNGGSAQRENDEHRFGSSS